MAQVMKRTKRGRLQRSRFTDIEMSYDPRGQEASGSTGGVVLRKVDDNRSIYRANRATPKTAGTVFVGDALWQKFGDKVPTDTHSNFVGVRCDFNYETATDLNGIPLPFGGAYTADMHRAAIAGQIKAIGRANAACHSSGQLGVGTTESISTTGVMNVRAPVMNWDGTRAFLEPGVDVYITPPPMMGPDDAVSTVPVTLFPDMESRHNPVLMPGNSASFANESAAATDRFFMMLTTAVDAAEQSPSTVPDVPHLTRFCAHLVGGWTDTSSGTGPQNYGFLLETMLMDIMNRLVVNPPGFGIVNLGRSCRVALDFNGNQGVFHLYLNPQNNNRTSTQIVDFPLALRTTIMQLQAGNQPARKDATLLYLRTWTALHILTILLDAVRDDRNFAVQPAIADTLAVNAMNMFKQNGGAILRQYIDQKIATGLSVAQMLAPAYMGTTVEATDDSGIVVIARA